MGRVCVEVCFRERWVRDRLGEFSQTLSSIINWSDQVNRHISSPLMTFQLLLGPYNLECHTNKALLNCHREEERRGERGVVGVRERGGVGMGREGGERGGWGEREGWRERGGVGMGREGGESKGN